MKLTILERLMLLGLLPREGNVLTLKIVRDLKSVLSFSEEEIKEYELKSPTDNPNVFTWKKEANTVTAEVKIGEVAHSIIVEALKKLNDEKKLTEAHISIYDKFVDGKVESQEKE